jgi:hypothetical protein
VDEIKKCSAVLSPLFIGRGEHGGCDTTTMMAERWRSLEGGLAKIFSLPWIDSDARDIGRGSGSFYASGASLSSTRTASTGAAAVSASEKKTTTSFSLARFLKRPKR